MIDFISNAKITGGQNQSRVYKWPAAGATQATLARICPPGSKRHLRDENNNNIQLRNGAKWFKNGEYFNLHLYMKWGWYNGQYNGWYAYNNFNPGNTNYNSNKKMIYNIIP